MLPISHPAALEDQCQAAERDAQNAFDCITTNTGMDVSERDSSPWLTGRLLALIDQAEDGRAQLCRHLAQGPRPAFAALWAPGHIVCEHCVDALDRTPQTPGCDHCGANPDLVNLHALRLEALVVTYALCDTCEADDHTEQR